MLITRATLVSPGLEQPDSWIRIDGGGRIAELGCGPAPPAGADDTLDAGNRRVLPGFIDLHSHGADGSDVCDDDLEALRRIARRKLREGVTTWLPTTLTQPRERLVSIAGKVAEFRAERRLTRCPGLHLEGPFIARERAGAQNPAFVRPPDFGELEEIHRICPVSILSLAPELPGAIGLIARARELGIVCSAAHTSATAPQLREAVAAGLRHLTHFGNAMTGLHQREIGAVGEGLVNDSLLLEVIADGVHLAPDMLRLLFRLVPLDRLLLITDSIAASWRADGEIELGGLPVIIEDGVARLKEGGTLAGSTLRFNDGLRLLAKLTGRPLSDLVQVTSLNQARSLGLADLGRIVPGYHADLAILDDDFSVWKTLVAGREP